jgi:hypothetical protein
VPSLIGTEVWGSAGIGRLAQELKQPGSQARVWRSLLALRTAERVNDFDTPGVDI